MCCYFCFATRLQYHILYFVPSLASPDSLPALLRLSHSLREVSCVFFFTVFYDLLYLYCNLLVIL